MIKKKSINNLEIKKQYINDLNIKKVKRHQRIQFIKNTKKISEKKG